ncbi:MAG: hypothetical protein HYZ22_14505 [Chloroflexi bacterium]|nr:hypothetical protein [Chloroflexota bacterium]
MENLRQTDDKQGWQLEFSLESLLVDADYDLQLLQESLPALLDSAKQLTSQLIDPSIMEAEIQAVSSKFSDVAHKTITYCINYRE